MYYSHLRLLHNRYSWHFSPAHHLGASKFPQLWKGLVLLHLGLHAVDECGALQGAGADWRWGIWRMHITWVHQSPIQCQNDWWVCIRVLLAVDECVTLQGAFFKFHLIIAAAQEIPLNSISHNSINDIQPPHFCCNFASYQLLCHAWFKIVFFS